MIGRWSKTEVLTDTETGQRVGELARVVHTGQNGVVYHGWDGHVLDSETGRRVMSDYFDSKWKAKRWVEKMTAHRTSRDGR